MDRRSKKLEKKRKQRTAAKKKVRAQALRRAAVDRELVKSAASAPFGPCWISEGWDDLSSPALVNVVVTRQLGTRYLPITVLVDRTCLGVKDGFSLAPCTERELEDVIDRFAEVHGAMHACEPLLAQSIVFHAIDYARKLGFEPNPDFPAAVFGARPDSLLDTPWSAPERPVYVSGPHDDPQSILTQLRARLGEDGFDRELEGFDEDDDDVIDTQGETVPQET